MGLPNRTRDFTSATWAELMESLSGPTEESREFRDFWNNYGSCFDNLDLWNEAVMIDEFISQSRYLMSDLAPREFQRVYDRIHELDEAFGKDCENTVVELQAYGKSLDALTEAISGKGFPASFDKGKLDAKLSRFSVQVNSEKAAFIRTIMDKLGLSRKEAEQIWKLLKTSDNRNWFLQKDFDNLHMGLSAGAIPFQPTGIPTTFLAELLFWLLAAGLFWLINVIDWDAVGEATTGGENQIIYSGIVFTPNVAAAAVDELPERQREHIMDSKHLWEKVNSGGPEDPEDWWEQIKNWIKKVLIEGTESIYKIDNTGVTFIKTLEVAGQVIQVTYRVIDGIVHIGNAWVLK